MNSQDSKLLPKLLGVMNEFGSQHKQTEVISP